MSVSYHLSFFHHSSDLNDYFSPSEITVKLIASFLLSYPLAGLLKRIPDAHPWKKNVFIIAVPCSTWSVYSICGMGCALCSTVLLAPTPSHTT